MSSKLSQDPVRLSFFRRAGRKVMRWARPAALPFLHRLQMRFQSAVDTSSIPSRLDQLAQSVGAMQSHMPSILARLDQMRSLTGDQLLQLQRLQIAVDALRLDLDALLPRTEALLHRSSLSLGTEVLLQSPFGFLLAPSEDVTLLSAIWESGGRLEPGTVDVMLSLLNEGDIVVDVGAHVGLTVLPAARKVGSAGRVVAIEPGSRVFALLQRTLALNFLADRVALHQCAAGSEEGKAYLHVAPNLGESSLLDIPTSGHHESVEVKTVDSLIQPKQRVRLVKIDAEGYETRVWQGMRRVLDDNPDLLALVEFAPAHLRRAGIPVEDWLAGFTADRFALYEVDEMSGQLRTLRSVEQLRNVGSMNLLMLRHPPAMYPQLSFL